MTFSKKARAVVAVLALAAGFSMIAVDFAEARRGGGFGSRGARTFDAPAATRTAPREAAPINRSMTPNQAAPNQPGAQTPAAAQRPGAAAQRPGMFGGMMGGILGGLMLGGLIGLLLGNGLGGLAGFLGLLFQVALIGLLVWLAIRFFSRRNAAQPAAAGVHGGNVDPNLYREQADAEPARAPGGMFGALGGGAGAAAAGPVRGAPAPGGMADTDEVGITGEDLNAFERLLHEIQEAFANEDYAGLRARATPEIVSYLSEELSSNAVKGLKNEVSDVKLL